MQVIFDKGLGIEAYVQLCEAVVLGNVSIIGINLFNVKIRVCSTEIILIELVGEVQMSAVNFKGSVLSEIEIFCGRKKEKTRFTFLSFVHYVCFQRIFPIQ